MDPLDFYNKWERWLIRLGKEVNYLVSNRFIFKEIIKIKSENSFLEECSQVFWEYLHDTYLDSTLINIRRLTENPNRDNTNITFVRLLKEIKEHSHIITKELFVSKIPKDYLDDIWYLTKKNLDPCRVQADLNQMEVKARKCEKFATMTRAHNDKREIETNNIPTYIELDECVDFLDELLVKYKKILAFTEVENTTYYYDDWKDIFKQPWVK